MIAVFVDAPSLIISEAIGRLLVDMGFGPAGDAPTADVVVRDLTDHRAPYPPPPAGTPALAVVSTAEEADLVELLRLGYRGLHRPDDVLDDLRASLPALAAGEVWAEGALVEKAKRPTVAPRLTAREAEVLTLLARGLPNKRIAHRLAIAEKTVKIHVSSILHKHQARNRIDLLARRNMRLHRD